MIFFSYWPITDTNSDIGIQEFVKCKFWKTALIVPTFQQSKPDCDV